MILSLRPGFEKSQSYSISYSLLQSKALYYDVEQCIPGADPGIFDMGGGWGGGGVQTLLTILQLFFS